jgi:membrane protease YdiL (CAAX protease family)
LPILPEPRPPADPARPDLAPRWHTAALLALYLAVAITGLALTRQGAAPAIAQEGGSRAAIYLPMCVVQLLLVVYVARVGRPRWALSSLLGERWTTARRAGVDVVLAVALWLAIRGLELAWIRMAGPPPHAIAAILPGSSAERIAWVIVSVTVGTCEELVFRGYLRIQLGACLGGADRGGQRDASSPRREDEDVRMHVESDQRRRAPRLCRPPTGAPPRQAPSAFTGRAWLAILIQAVIFGLAHAQQGAASAARIAIYGLALGAVAQSRRSVVPCILAHVATDLVSGLVH